MPLPLTGSEMSVTLPTAGEPFTIKANECPVVVNGKWHIPVGEYAIFKSRRLLWWRWWALIKREGFILTCPRR